jgi:alanine racemase
MRPATATIDLAAVRHNLARVRELAPRSRVVAVVKANGYGHGAARLVPALAAAEMLGVACLEEALTLRAAGARQPALLMEGAFEPAELATCAAEGFEVVVHHAEQVRMLERARPTRPLVAWLKVDTGMHRLGVAPSEARRLHARLSACRSVARVRLMTHFASADLPEPRPTEAQLACLAALDLPGERSLANSAGVVAWPQAHAEWVRPGIMLYGVSPLPGLTGAAHGLRPAMTLATRLIALRDIPAGDSVGYAGAWTARRPTRVGTAAIGYGDGYPRHAPSGTPVLINGREVPLIGRVSMDMITVDLTDQPDAAVGDPVILWGDGLPAERVAEAAGTIAYELLCRVTARVHIRVVGA